MRPTPFSVRLCDGLVLAFAGWTLLCNATVFLGGSLHDLLIATLMAAAAAAAWLVRRRRRGRAAPPGEDPPAGGAPATESRGPAGGLSIPLLAVPLLAPLVIAVGFALTDRVHLFWWSAVIYLLFALVLALRTGETGSRAPLASRGRETGVWLLALAAALCPLFLHRFSPDDSLYLNIAVDIAERPDAPLLAADTLHGLEGVPLIVSSYEIHGFEILGGAVTYLTGLQAAEASHWILASFFSLFVVLAAARLLRVLAPERWFACLCAVVCALVLISREPQSYG